MLETRRAGGVDERGANGREGKASFACLAGWSVENDIVTGIYPALTIDPGQLQRKLSTTYVVHVIILHNSKHIVRDCLQNTHSVVVYSIFVLDAPKT